MSPHWPRFVVLFAPGSDDSPSPPTTTNSNRSPPPTLAPLSSSSSSSSSSLLCGVSLLSLLSLIIIKRRQQQSPTDAGSGGPRFDTRKLSTWVELTLYVLPLDLLALRVLDVVLSSKLFIKKQNRTLLLNQFFFFLSKVEKNTCPSLLDDSTMYLARFLIFRLFETVAKVSLDLLVTRSFSART